MLHAACRFESCSNVLPSTLSLSEIGEIPKSSPGRDGILMPTLNYGQAGSHVRGVQALPAAAHFWMGHQILILL